MTIKFPAFVEDLQMWLETQPPVMSSALPARIHRKLFKLIDWTDSGKAIVDEDSFLIELFEEGDESKRATVVGPLIQYLSDTYGLAEDSEEVDEDEPEPASEQVTSVSDEIPWNEGSGYPEVRLAKTTRSENGVYPVVPSSLPPSDSPPSQWFFPNFYGFGEEQESWEEVQIIRYGDRLMYQWSEQLDDVVYRVVTSDEEEPYSPDDFCELAAVTVNQVEDDRPASSPYRFITVWAYPKSSLGGNMLGPGRLVARTLYVHPLENIELQYVDNSIVGRWTPLQKSVYSSVCVKVAKLPVGLPPGGFIRTGTWYDYILPDDGTGYLGGFQDLDVSEGNRYYYVVAASVSLGDHDEVDSKPEVKSYLVESSSPRKVEDLTASLSPQGDRWRLEWTAPATGHVSIYRSTVAPELYVVERAEIPLETVGAAGLTEGQRIQNVSKPILDREGKQLPGRWCMDDVLWPEGEEFDQIYLTPVTRVSDLYSIGVPVTQKRVRKIRGLTLVQRMKWQLVTFEWPDSALKISYYKTGRGEEWSSGMPREKSIDRKRYNEQGGFVLDDLPPTGATIHLTATSHFGGKQIISDPVSLDVPPLWEYVYDFNWEVNFGGGIARRALRMWGRSDLVQVTVRSARGECPPNDCPVMVLIYREDRLPLSMHDGSQVPLQLKAPGKEAAEVVGSVRAPSSGESVFYFDVGAFSDGYFRLMVSAESEKKAPNQAATCLERYALIDPSISVLQYR